MSDLIRRQDAIDAIRCDITVTGRQNAELVAATIGTFADRIKALPSAEPDVPDTNVGDMISRQAAIDALQKEINKGIPPFDDVMGSIRCGVRLARNIIEDLPSAKPRCIATIQLSQEQLDEAFEKVKTDILSVNPKTGKWIGGELGECSVCGHKGCASDIWDRCKEHFCPNCGAKMEDD